MTYFKDNPEIEAILADAYKTAESLDQKYVTVDHLFYALIKSKTMIRILTEYGVALDDMTADVYTYLQGQPNEVLTGTNAHVTSRVELVMKQAIAQLLFLGRTALHPMDLFVTIAQDKHSYAVYFIAKYGIDNVVELVNFCQKRKLLTDPNSKNETDPEKNTEILEEFCTNLNSLAKAGSLDDLIGREDEMAEITHTLAKRNKSNILLVGEAGVGKTALAEGLANRIVAGKVPKYLRDWTVWGLDVGSIVAGSRYRGDFEEKVTKILGALSSLGKCILFIDEAHQIKGAGAGGGGGQGSSLDFANMIKPVIAKGKVKVIASTTWEEYNSTFDKDRALMRRFHRLSVDEPTADQTKQILTGSKSQFEKFHGGTITQEAISAAVDLSIRYQADKKLPDKAIDIIDSACAKAKVMLIDDTSPFVIDKQEILQEISRITGLPVANIDNAKQKAGLLTIDNDIKMKLYDQDSAVDSVVNRILVARAGLKDPNRPIGSFLFLGPTGVGKTYLAQTLAEKMQMHMMRFDMSEYSEAHNVSKLIGAPPGYVGHGSGAAGDGLLISGLDQNPNSVILFDEIEKAHPDVIQVLLQMMDAGQISGGTGKTADCKNSIIIMTSNLGAAKDAEGKETIGFGNFQQKDHVNDAVKAHFKPEFIGRISDICRFNKLGDFSFRKIVVKAVSEINQSLTDSGVRVQLSEEVIDHIVALGDKEKLGARPIANIIDRVIKLPLSKAILFGGATSGTVIDAVMANGEIKLRPRETLESTIRTIAQEAEIA